MTIEEILERRLTSQNLSVHSFTKPSQIVQWFGAVQSQDFPAAIWAISQRLNNASKEQIETYINEGKILRTHVMRPTWHFVAQEDIRWLVELTGARVKKAMKTYDKTVGINDALIQKGEEIIVESLKGNKSLTRTELGEILKKHGITWQGFGLAHIVSYAELNAVICSGPKKEKQQTYALLTERAPKAQSMPREAALKELTKRYFQSHGPAQIIDFVWWSGLLTADAKIGIELNPDLHHETIEGKTYYFFDTNIHKGTNSVYLLPNYDEYTVAFKDRDALIKNVDKTKLDARQNSLFNNVVVIDGKVEGVWRRTIKAKRIDIETRLFRALSAKEKEELTECEKQYTHFLGF